MSERSLTILVLANLILCSCARSVPSASEIITKCFENERIGGDTFSISISGIHMGTDVGGAAFASERCRDIVVRVSAANSSLYGKITEIGNKANAVEPLGIGFRARIYVKPSDFSDNVLQLKMIGIEKIDEMSKEDTKKFLTDQKLI